MTVVVIERPTEPVISLVQAKLHLGEDTDDRNEQIDLLIDAAQEWLSGPGGWLGRSLTLQTLELQADGFCRGPIHLPYPPIASVVSVKYDDSDGVEQTLAPEAYRTILRPDGRLSVSHLYDAAWPDARRDTGTVRVRYTAGYASAAQVPAPIRQAVLLLVGHWFDNGEAASGSAMVSLPYGVEHLLSPYRIWSL
jgi:uncharacterized phiE125 gp8 family phage protein